MEILLKPSLPTPLNRLIPFRGITLLYKDGLGDKKLIYLLRSPSTFPPKSSEQPSGLHSDIESNFISCGLFKLQFVLLEYWFVRR